MTEKGSNAQSNNNYQYNNNSQINNSISIDDSGKQQYQSDICWRGQDNGGLTLILPWIDTAGYTLTSQSRADLMQKLARGDVNLGAVPAPAADFAPTLAASTFM